jgi:hypothetical protein
VLSAAFLRGNGVIRRTQQVIQVDDNDTTHKHKESSHDFCFFVFPGGNNEFVSSQLEFFFCANRF